MSLNGHSSKYTGLHWFDIAYSFIFLLLLPDAMGYSVINRHDVEPKIRFLDTLYSEIFFRFLVADKDKRGIANVTDEG